MQIIEIIFPVFAIAFIGYVAAYVGLLKEEHIVGITRFVFYIAIPVLLFNSLANVTLPEQINWGFFLSYYLVVFTIYGLAMLIGRVRFSYSSKEQGIFGMGSSYSNLVLVGLPVITAAFGDEALLPMFMIISIHSATLFFLTTIMTERENETRRTLVGLLAQTANKLVKNPIIIGLVFGLSFNIFSIPIPDMIAETIAILARAALPCALIVLGASLSTYQLAGKFKEAWTIVGLKIIIQPVLVWMLAFVVFEIDPLWGTVAVMAAGMPVGINAYMFAQKYEVCIAPMATAVLLSTLLAIGTLSFWLTIFL